MGFLFCNRIYSVYPQSLVMVMLNNETTGNYSTADGAKDKLAIIIKKKEITNSHFLKSLLKLLYKLYLMI